MLLSLGGSNESQIFVAYLAALLVQHYAIYAKHSGIAEIKTVLGGFVIQRFLGTWTLITKSFGLVCMPSALFPKQLLTACRFSQWHPVCGSEKRDRSSM